MLQISLFGPGVLTLGAQVLRPHSAKALALLAFLAVESDRAHARQKVAALLWPEAAEASARQSLRQALYSLKIAGCIEAGHETLRFVRGPGVAVDVHDFLAALAGGDAADWRAAAALYRAPLLEGRELDGAHEWMAWLRAARERLHGLAARNCERLVVESMAQSDLPAALAHAHAWRALEPASEIASRQLIRVLAARGERQGMSAEWARLTGELDTQPSRETMELYHALAEVPGDEAEAEPLSRAARAAEKVYAFGNALDLYERALRLAPGASARRLDILLHKEAALERLGRRAEQAAAIAEAIGIAEKLGDEARLAAALLRKAGASAYRHDKAEAIRAGERALDIFRRLGDAPGEAEALRELGFVHWRAEDHASALDHARAALELHRRLGDTAGEASALHNLAEIYRGLGSPAAAIEWYERALGLHWAARNRQGEILTLFGMAKALEQLGKPGSREKYERALALAEGSGERTMHARALHALALQACSEGDLERGLQLMRRAVEVDRAIGYAHALGHDLVELSHIHELRGEHADARATLQEAAVWFDYIGQRGAVQSSRAGRHGVKSHLPLGEGKVYCEFESPLARSNS